MILVKKKIDADAFTSTSCWLLHGAMLGVWRKTRLPHPNRRRKMLLAQNGVCFFCGLVATYKPPHPHKEEKQKNPPFL